MIKWLHEIEPDDIQFVGGKAVNLARLTRYGFDVPRGFVITTDMYGAYLNRDGLRERINSIQHSGKTVAEQSKEIQAFFVTEKVDSEVISAIVKAFKQLNAVNVAVRSSATHEDLPGMSFAGQYSSYLHVTEAALFEKIMLCWQSLWNERAMEYRLRNTVTGEDAQAIIVQTMVNASSAGILFTANPLSGIRNEMLINAAPGLGDAIVSGEVQPNQIVINKETGSVVDSQCINTPVLSDEMLSKLLQTGRMAEQEFGSPQDMEFAFTQSGELKILQTRDITTLFPIEELIQDSKLRAYLCSSTILLGMKEPFTPLGFDILSNLYPITVNIMTARKKKPLTNSFVKHAGSRIYMDITYLMASKMISKQFANVFSNNDLPMKGVMYKVIDEYGRTFRHQGIHFRFPFGIVKYSLSLAGKSRSINKIPYDKRYDALRQLSDTAYEKQISMYYSLQSDEERLAFAVTVLENAFILTQEQAMYPLAVNNRQKIEKALKKYFADTYDAEILVHSLEDCVTQSLMLRLNEYAEHLDILGKQPDIHDPEFRKILEDFGHRGNIELDIGTPRWREDPSYLLELTKSFVNGKMYQRNLNDHADKREKAETLIEDVYMHLREKKGERAAARLKNLMVNYRFALAMREYPKSCVVKFMFLARKALLVIGERLEKEGRLQQRDDIFFLYMKDILTDQDLKSLVIRNRQQYEKEMKRTAIPRIVLNNGAAYYNSTVIDPDADHVQGMPLSPGSYEGVIKIVFDPKSAQLKKGEIMVTESTNPAWTPLFAIAGALIMEYGGPVSHGGIVAREYGIPAVVGIPSATSILKDGQRARVDGETGLVEVLNS